MVLLGGQEAAGGPFLKLSTFCECIVEAGIVEVVTSTPALVEGPSISKGSSSEDTDNTGIGEVGPPPPVPVLHNSHLDP